ncbi:MAG: asparagine synthase (glutamine-hydrolyzing) [Rhodocyclaceae bacterium]|nr:asparagine synthase (glutamine-hydrolyzing) [Rhodocyclaceae bacterium]
MCGFVITNLSVTDGEFQAALDSIAFRGPDNNSGPVRLGSLTMGHVRLRILGGTDSGNQPMFSADGNLALLFNGEIYNFREIAAKEGLHLITGTDTELLLQMYSRYEMEFLDCLNGMFSFVVVDRHRGVVAAARDRLGVKPMYVWRHGDNFAIASETLPIRKLLGSDRPDEFTLRQYKTLRSPHGGRSFFHGIGAFPPAHSMTDWSYSRYWELGEPASTPPSDDELEHLLRSSIAFRMVADVEVGSFLSGGLDSSVVTSLAQVRNTWCAGFPGDEDSRLAANLASDWQLNHHQITLNHCDFLHLAREMIGRRREPLCVPNEVALYAAARDASEQGIKCLLCGEGADELFAGYDRIFSWAASTTVFDLRRFAELYCYGTEPDFEVIEDALVDFMPLREPYLIVSAFFQIAHLQSLLRRLDHATMLASLEAREPLVDYRLVERLFGVPFDYKCAELGPKTPLKRLSAELLPNYVLEREKVGFAVPLASIFGSPPNSKAGYGAWFDFNLNCLEWC